MPKIGCVSETPTSGPGAQYGLILSLITFGIAFFPSHHSTTFTGHHIYTTCYVTFHNPHPRLAQGMSHIHPHPRPRELMVSDVAALAVAFLPPMALRGWLGPPENIVRTIRCMANDTGI